jgi:hypothetical protein
VGGETVPWAHPASCTMGNGSFPEVNRPGHGGYHPPNLAPRLKKEYRYTSTPPLGPLGLFFGDLYLYLYLYTSYAFTIFEIPTFRYNPNISSLQLLYHLPEAGYITLMSDGVYPLPPTPPNYGNSEPIWP